MVVDPMILPSMDEECKQGLAALTAAGQEHIFASWKAGEGDTEKISLLKQANEVDQGYPGGLKKYKENAVKLLKESKQGVNPLEGYVPSVPAGMKVEMDTEAYDTLTKRGLEEVKNACFVMVAGGLGERLGYPGIKLSLPVETATMTCFLQLYISYILEWQNLSGGDCEIPFAIMTSDDTHSSTEQLLVRNEYFGMKKDQITLMKQGKVPSLIDNSARFATNGFSLMTKPHGHGDVHQLLFSKGLTKTWLDNGKKWVIVMQDTHSLITHKILSTLGVSARDSFDMNSVSIPRKPGEASGSICLLTKPNEPPLTINIEYNQLNPLLNDTLGHGDVAGDDGFSPYPGNVNSFVLNLSVYHSVLQESQGVVPEFVNPKYADAARETFKSPTRLECMMQDIPKFFPKNSKIGFTSYDRWLYCPVKNATKDGAVKQQAGQVASCAAAGEDVWNMMMIKMLKESGVRIDEGEKETWLGVEVTGGARAMLSAKFAPTHEVMRSKLQGNVSMTASSLLIVNGRNVTIKNLTLDGTLVINAEDSANVTIDGLTVTNKGWARTPVSDSDDTPASLRIRGYTTDTTPEFAAVLSYSTGDHVVSKL